MADRSVVSGSFKGRCDTLPEFASCHAGDILPLTLISDLEDILAFLQGIFSAGVPEETRGGKA